MAKADVNHITTQSVSVPTTPISHKNNKWKLFGNNNTNNNTNKKQTKKNKFWKRKSKNTSGNIHQVRGAQYPPLSHNNPYYMDSNNNKLNHNNNNNSESDINDNIRDTPTTPSDINSFDINGTNQYDIDTLIQNVKNDKLKNKKQFDELNHIKSNLNTKLSNNNNNNNGNNNENIIHNNNKIRDWDEIKDENEARLRKNRNRINLLNNMLKESQLNSMKLRKICWRGIPNDIRPKIWRLLLGYEPKNLSRRNITINKKRDEYKNLINRYYNNNNEYHRSDVENKIIRQISLDVPRTSPELKLFQLNNIELLLKRSLYIWSLKHAATGYVQGINDLITPFVYIFLDEYLKNNDNNKKELLNIISNINSKDLLNIEADSYWCLDYLIESLQNNYINEQPGIQKMISQLEDVIKKQSIKLHKHLKLNNMEFIQFAFRWMNCLLLRELSLKNIIRLWDTYLCEGVQLSNGFAEFHVFVCAALLMQFEKQLMIKDFAQIMLFLQDMQNKTKKWGEREMETILSTAYLYQQYYGKNKKSLY